MHLEVQLLTKNDCYKTGQKIKPKGVMVHSTGANNPNVRRYVPGNSVIGYNISNNHWNNSGIEKCAHAFLGKFADGSIGVVQTLPWDHRAWHCGSGRKGSANNTHISFEICEDALNDATYFSAVYQEAAELTAMLCKQYNLDPLKDGVVICHREGYNRGIASGHADVLHWFPKFGKSMDDFRKRVVEIMKGDDEDMSYEQWKQYMEQYRAELANQPVPEWAEKTGEWQKAFDEKIVADKSRPQDLTTRAEVAAMVIRGQK